MDLQLTSPIWTKSIVMWNRCVLSNTDLSKLFTRHQLLASLLFQGARTSSQEAIVSLDFYCNQDATYLFPADQLMQPSHPLLGNFFILSESLIYQYIFSAGQLRQWRSCRRPELLAQTTPLHPFQFLYFCPWDCDISYMLPQ